MRSVSNMDVFCVMLPRVCPLSGSAVQWLKRMPCLKAWWLSFSPTLTQSTSSIEAFLKKSTRGWLSGTSLLFLNTNNQSWTKHNSFYWHIPGFRWNFITRVQQNSIHICCSIFRWKMKQHLGSSYLLLVITKSLMPKRFWRDLTVIFFFFFFPPISVMLSCYKDTAVINAPQIWHLASDFF